MPIPIGLVNRNTLAPAQESALSGMLDVSFLANHMPQKEASDFTVTLSDRDADHVMDIWLHAKQLGKDTFNIAELGIDNKDIIRLKSRGLIVGGVGQVSFTNKGRTVVKTMTLGENNKFLKSRKKKSYTEILASMDKRGKKGYRMAGVFDENSHLLKLSYIDPDKMHVLNELMENIRSHFGKGVTGDDNNPSFEMMDEAMGTCYISVSYLESQDAIYIDKYYESEMLNDEFAQNVTIPYVQDPIGNYDKLFEAVVSAMEKMK